MAKLIRSSQGKPAPEFSRGAIAIPLFLLVCTGSYRNQPFRKSHLLPNCASREQSLQSALGTKHQDSTNREPAERGLPVLPIPMRTRSGRKALCSGKKQGRLANQFKPLFDKRSVSREFGTVIALLVLRKWWAPPIRESDLEGVGTETRQCPSHFTNNEMARASNIQILLQPSLDPTKTNHSKQTPD